MLTWTHLPHADPCSWSGVLQGSLQCAVGFDKQTCQLKALDGAPSPFPEVGLPFLMASQPSVHTLCLFLLSSCLHTQVWVPWEPPGFPSWPFPVLSATDMLALAKPPAHCLVICTALSLPSHGSPQLSGLPLSSGCPCPPIHSQARLLCELSVIVPPNSCVQLLPLVCSKAITPNTSARGAS